MANLAVHAGEDWPSAVREFVQAPVRGRFAGLAGSAAMRDVTPWAAARVSTRADGTSR